MRKIIALTAAAGLLATLTACSTSAPSGACEPSKKSGEASSLIEASGPFGTEPIASFPTPLVTTGIEVSTVDAGDGETIFPGQYANFQATAYSATSGEVIIKAAYDSTAPLTVRVGEPVEGTSNVGYLFECVEVGSRIAATLKASDFYGFYNVSDQTGGLENPDASIVLIVDVESSILGKAYGTPQVAQQGMPSVVTAPDGTPGVTIVGDAPTTLKTAVLQQADGAKVEKGQVVYIHYLRVDWNDVTSLKSTWTEAPGNPQAVLLSDIDATTGEGLNPGMLQALIGQRVGSQVLAVVPPAFGFPDGTAPSDVTPGSTLVYVIDILGIKSK